MDFGQLIAHRYSVRSYQTRPVEEEKLERMIHAAMLAPTAANRQPFRLIVIPTENRVEELKQIYSKAWFSEAPYVICICAVHDEAWKRRDGRNYAFVDTAIAMDHLILAAADEGLGTCWVAAFDPEAAREILDIPDDQEPVAFTPLGYAADNPGPKKRKTEEELVRYMV